MVTREDVGRGVQTLASPRCESTMVGLVRCDVPLSVIPRSRPCLPLLQPHRGPAAFCASQVFSSPFSCSALLRRRRSRHLRSNCPLSTSVRRSIRPEPGPGPSPTRAQDHRGRQRTSRPQAVPTFRLRAIRHPPAANSTASSAPPRPSLPPRISPDRRPRPFRRSSRKRPVFSSPRCTAASMARERQSTCADSAPLPVRTPSCS